MVEVVCEVEWLKSGPVTGTVTRSGAIVLPPDLVSRVTYILCFFRSFFIIRSVVRVAKWLFLLTSS